LSADNPTTLSAIETNEMQAIGNPKSKAQMPNQIQNPKLKMMQSVKANLDFGL